MMGQERFYCSGEDSGPEYRKDRAMKFGGAGTVSIVKQGETSFSPISGDFLRPTAMRVEASFQGGLQVREKRGCSGQKNRI